MRRRTVALLGAALFLLAPALLVVVAACADSEESATPTASPTAAATVAPSPSASPTPAAAETPPGRPISGELAQRLDEIKAQVAEVRGLDFIAPVEARDLTREEAEAYTLSQIDEETRDRVAVAQDIYTLFDLIPEDADLLDLLIDLTTSQILGFYDIEDDTLYLVQDMAELSAVDESILAHEYTHALQDQHFDLEELLDIEEEDWDRGLAIDALVEGDATLTEAQYAIEYQNLFELGAEALSEYGGALDELEDYPPALVSFFEFPYEAGSEFVMAGLLGTQELSADVIFADPPLSSEQILHPEKYFDEPEEPLPVELPDISDTLGSTWRLVESNTFGEFALREYLLTYLEDVFYVEDATTGWGGDAWALYNTDDGDKLALLAIAWDDINEASEFFLTYLDWLDARSAGQWTPLDSDAAWWLSEAKSIYARQDEGTVTIVVSSDQDALAAARDALGRPLLVTMPVS